MQAIQTRYIPCGNVRGSRIKAWCERGSCYVPYPHEASEGEEAHRVAALALVDKFKREDAAKYGTPVDQNPWGRPFVSGGLPGGDWAHVFVHP